MEFTDFIAFDVETATSKRNSLCQLGYAVVKDLEIVDTGNFLVKPPGNEYEARNSVIHKITALDTNEAPASP